MTAIRAIVAMLMLAAAWAFGFERVEDNRPAVET